MAAGVLKYELACSVPLVLSEKGESPDMPDALLGKLMSRRHKKFLISYGQRAPKYRSQTIFTRAETSNGSSTNVDISVYG